MKRFARYKMNDWPIRYKLIMHFLIISILPAIGLGALVSWAAENIIERQVNAHTSQLIGNVSKSLEMYAASLQNHTYFIAFNPLIQRFLTGGDAALGSEEERYQANKFLQSFTTLYPEIAGMMVVNSRGEYLGNQMYARTNKNLTEEYWYQEAEHAKGIFKLIGHPAKRNVISHANYKDAEVVSAVRAILEPTKETTLGVVLIDLKLRVIAETVQNVRLGKSGYLMVIDEDGSTIYAPRGFAGTRFDRSLLTGGSGMFSQVIDGQRLQFIYTKSDFTNWTTVGVFNMRDSVFESRQINLFIVTFVFAAVLLGIAASYFLSHSISRPITQLASSMRKVEEGNLNIRYNGKRLDEVGRLGRSFNGMLTQISRLIRQVGEEQRKKREAELRSLQAHIKPHFLYNTLDTIQWLARRDGAAEAAEVVGSLSKLFRIGLSKGREMIPLSEELEHVESYLNIQKTRYKDKLGYSIETDEGIQPLIVPKLVLQPIVENAIYHGIKERRGPGHIAIRAFAGEGALIIKVEDDGAGMNEERLDRLRRALEAAGTGSAQIQPFDGMNAVRTDPMEGYGLVNIQERIRLTFGEGYGLRVESALRQGTTITIKLPVVGKLTSEEGETNGDGEGLEGPYRR